MDETRFPLVLTKTNGKRSTFAIHNKVTSVRQMINEIIKSKGSDQRAYGHLSVGVKKVYTVTQI